MTEILDGTNINTDVFSYSAPKLHESGGKVVRLLNFNTKANIQVNTPLILTWGASETTDPATGKPLGKYAMSLQYPTEEYSNPNLAKFLESSQAIETKVKQDALKNSVQWFGKQHTSIEVIDALFNPMLKYPKVKGTQTINYDKPPTLNVKIPCYDGQWKCEIYDEDRKPLFLPKITTDSTPLDYLTKMAKVVCLIECSGIWFVNGKFSITWSLKQAVVQRPKMIEEGVCHIQLNAADRASLKESPAAATTEDAEAACAVVDSDGEEEETTEEVVTEEAATPATPPPAPVEVKPAGPAKKRVVKKTTAPK